MSSHSLLFHFSDSGFVSLPSSLSTSGAWLRAKNHINQSIFSFHLLYFSSFLFRFLCLFFLLFLFLSFFFHWGVTFSSPFCSSSSSSSPFSPFCDSLCSFTYFCSASPWGSSSSSSPWVSSSCFVFLFSSSCLPLFFPCLFPVRSFCSFFLSGPCFGAFFCCSYFLSNCSFLFLSGFFLFFVSGFRFLPGLGVRSFPQNISRLLVGMFSRGGRIFSPIFLPSIFIFLQMLAVISFQWGTRSQLARMPWDGLQTYASPPFSLISRVLVNVRQSRGLQLTLVAPFWPQHPWFPYLLELLVEVPFFLPRRRDLLRQPHFHHYHQNLPVLQLTAFRISSDPLVIPDSLQRWLVSLPTAVADLQGYTRPSGQCILPGAIAMAIYCLGLRSLKWPNSCSTFGVLSLS